MAIFSSFCTTHFFPLLREMYIKAAQTNMEMSECDTEQEHINPNISTFAFVTCLIEILHKASK